MVRLRELDGHGGPAHGPPGAQVQGGGAQPEVQGHKSFTHHNSRNLFTGGIQPEPHQPKQRPVARNDGLQGERLLPILLSAHCIGLSIMYLKVIKKRSKLLGNVLYG